MDLTTLVLPRKCCFRYLWDYVLTLLLLLEISGCDNHRECDLFTKRVDVFSALFSGRRTGVCLIAGNICSQFSLQPSRNALSHHSQREGVWGRKKITELREKILASLHSRTILGRTFFFCPYLFPLALCLSSDICTGRDVSRLTASARTLLHCKSQSYSCTVW